VGKLAERFAPRIFCSDTTASALMEYQGVNPERFTTVHDGDVVAEADLSVEVVRGIHVDLSKMAIPSAKKETVRVSADVDFPFEKLGKWMKNYPGGEQLNFVLDPVNGKRIYVAGSYPDPSLIEVAQEANADITLLQVLSGGLLSGLEEQTLKMATASGCKILIPQHHDPLFPGSPKTDLTRFRQLVREKTDMEFKELDPGKWYQFD
jgi:L-ascorbate metabolism protein UlaG (beta-lactamase superfamily)